MELTQNTFNPINSSMSYLHSSDIILCFKKNKWGLIKNRYGPTIITPDVLIEILCDSIISKETPNLFKDGFKKDLYESIDNVFDRYKIQKKVIESIQMKK